MAAGGKERERLLRGRQIFEHRSAEDAEPPMAAYAEPTNEAALRQMGMPPPASGLDGRGIVIGFIDYGFDILHPALSDASGLTRFDALLDQNAAARTHPPLRRRRAAAPRRRRAGGASA